MNRLSEIRESKRISQTELAARVGVTARHIAFIENGDRKPSIDLAFKISKSLGVTLEDIFLREERTKSTYYNEVTRNKKE